MLSGTQDGTKCMLNQRRLNDLHCRRVSLRMSAA